MERPEHFECHCEMGESERLDLDEIRYSVKNYYLLEIQLREWGFLWIRQWKDIPCKIGDFNMDYWDLYLSDGKSIHDVWDGDNLEKWIEKCMKMEQEISKANHEENEGGCGD